MIEDEEKVERICNRTDLWFRCMCALGDLQPSVRRLKGRVMRLGTVSATAFSSVYPLSLGGAVQVPDG